MSRIATRHSLDVYPSYKGGHTVEAGGYVYELYPTHPNCNNWGYVPQHRLIAEEAIGRPLTRAEIVHHKDHNPLNNDPDNLEVMSRSSHTAYHSGERGKIQRGLVTETMVYTALQGRTIHQAADSLHVSHQTLRRNFPDILAPRQRKSPTYLDDPKAIEIVQKCAPDARYGYREIAHEYNISAPMVTQICKKYGIPWVKKTRKGEIHRQYRRKKTIPEQ